MKRRAAATARGRAAEALRAVLERGRRAAPLVGDLGRGLSPADQDLLRELVLGVLRWKSALDAEIRGVSRVPLEKLAPNLRELLEPVSARSKLFYRGNDVYDPQNVGFVSTVAEEGGHKFFVFDTAKKGNGNAGHEGPDYGTSLPPEEKRALLEYLKTF